MPGDGGDDAELLRETLAGENSSADTTVDTGSESSREDAGSEAISQTGGSGESAGDGEQAPQPSSVPEQHRVPLAELLAERDRRHSSDRELGLARAQLEQMNRQTAELQRQMQELRAPKQAPPDYIEDPDGWLRHSIGTALSPVEQRFRDVELQTEMLGKQVAVMQHGAEKVEAAQQEIARLYQSGDPRARADYAAIMRLPPAARYAELMDWHQRRDVYSKTGGDLGKYEQSLQEKLLADPAFLARAMEAAQKQAAARPTAITTQPIAQKRTTSLPSVSRMGAAAPINDQGADDIDDHELLRSVLKGR
jgi:hypothetical protein